MNDFNIGDITFMGPGANTYYGITVEGVEVKIVRIVSDSLVNVEVLVGVYKEEYTVRRNCVLPSRGPW